MTDIFVEIDWEGFKFTEGQWRKIISPFGDVAVRPTTRHWLSSIASRHKTQRTEPRPVPLSQKRKRLERIVDASRKLQDALREGPGSWFDDVELARSLPGCDLKTIPDLNTLMRTWREFQQSLDSLGQKAERDALDCMRTKPRPANIDDTLNFTLERLAEVYEDITGQQPKPRVSVAGEKEGIAYGPFIDFVTAFMKVLPGDERVSGDQINHFLRRRNFNGEHL